MRALTIMVLLTNLLASCKSPPSPVIRQPESVATQQPEPSPTPSPDSVAPTPMEPEKATPPRSALPEKVDCGAAETQLAMNQCAQQNYQRSDQVLNQVYQDLRATLSTPAKNQLQAAETAWLSFRDADCAFERSQFEGGSIAPLIYASCLEQLTDQRIADLELSASPAGEYQQADDTLNTVYQNLKARLDRDQQASLTTVQLAWLKYRDAHCEFAVTYGDRDR